MWKYAPVLVVLVLATPLKAASETNAVEVVVVPQEAQDGIGIRPPIQLQYTDFIIDLAKPAPLQLFTRPTDEGLPEENWLEVTVAAMRGETLAEDENAQQVNPDDLLGSHKSLTEYYLLLRREQAQAETKRGSETDMAGSSDDDDNMRFLRDIEKSFGLTDITAGWGFAENGQLTEGLSQTRGPQRDVSGENPFLSGPAFTPRESTTTISSAAEQPLSVHSFEPLEAAWSIGREGMSPSGSSGWLSGASSIGPMVSPLPLSSGPASGGQEPGRTARPVSEPLNTSNDNRDFFKGFDSF